MYTHGSNALKSEYYTADAPGESVQKKKTVRKSSSKKVVRMKKRAVALMLFAFLMAFTVLFRYAAITEEYNKLTTAREELELISAKVVETKVQAEGDMDPKRIEKEAERLGLRPPLKNQVEYISLGNTDNGEVLKAEEPSAFVAFINRMSVILEYLY
ncbi:MAG: hypothetical protein IJD91_02440 [Clostridia bacterium]|nr:hypothetical protein [Clostridia bacterium]